MGAFIGRTRELAVLEAHLDRVRKDPQRPGRALLVRGRRRVGKSRLLEEFIARSGVPAVFFTASNQGTERELALFAQAVAESSLPGASTFEEVTPTTWEAALRLLATAIPTHEPCVVVLDELPYLTGEDPTIEGTLQKVFDTILSHRRVLLVGVGSDLAMMEALNAYGRPFHQRANEMVVPALSPGETAVMMGLDAAAALDAYLITGGLPLIADEWPNGMPMWDYLARAVADPTSALVVSGERMLASEFPTTTQARRVLTAIGSGERTFTAIATAAGLQATSLERALATLIDKRVVVRTTPVSTARSRESRYYVADPYVRFWLSFIGPSLPEIERGAVARVLSRLQSNWLTWRGRAIEPVIREGIERMGSAGPAGQTGVVGGYWTRNNDPEIDLVFADQAPVAKTVTGVGSIKWLENSPFDSRDLGRLIVHRSQLPGATHSTPLVAVARSGFTVDGVIRITPEDVISSW